MCGSNDSSVYVYVNIVWRCLSLVINNKSADL